MSHLLSSFRLLRPWPRLLLFISLILLFGSLGSAVGILILQQVSGLPMTELPAYLGLYDDMEAMTHLAWYNTLSQLFVFLIPSMAFVFLMFGSFREGLWLRHPGLLLALVPLIVLGLSPAIGLLEAINHSLIPEGSWLESIARPQEDELQRLTQGILGIPGNTGLMLTILSVIVVPPICEELAFRGVLQPVLGRISGNVHVAVWLTAFVFSFIHFQFYGFLPRLVLGAVFGYMVVWSGSLWTSIFAHALHNALAFLAYRQSGTLDAQAAETDPGLWLSLLLVVGIASLLIMAKRSVFERHRRSFFGTEDQLPANKSL